MSMKNKKSLGQHWLKDRAILSGIVDCADLVESDTVLEIGPGLGTLTSELLRRSGQVIAVEFDKNLADKLPGQFPGKNLKVINSDILDYDLKTLPAGYKVVANIPYYITSEIIQRLMTTANKPSMIVLLVQKEVAERLAARPGRMSILAISAQVFAHVSLGPVVKSDSFIPPPKVDSQVVILQPYCSSELDGAIESDFFKVVKAGFSAKRKKLRSSLSAGLAMDKQQIEIYLKKANIDSNDRAEKLSIVDWVRLTKIICYNNK